LEPEYLFVVLAQIAPKLKAGALRLLIDLIALEFTEGTRGRPMAQRWLADQTGMSRGGVSRAIRELRALFPINVDNRQCTTFDLPLSWFPPQEPLFPPAPASFPQKYLPVDMSEPWPTNEATVAYKSGHGGQRIRTPWPTNEATVAYKSGHGGQPIRPRGLQMRPRPTQNQQLANSAAIRSDPEALSSLEGFVLLLDRIARVHHLEEGQRKEASQLSDWLYAFMVRHTVPEQPVNPPPEKVVARCMAIADLPTLQSTLQAVEQTIRKPIRKYAWFVTIFLEQIHRIPPELTLERFQIQFQKKPPRPVPDRDFRQELLRDTAGGVRNMA
jgi:hypothetical protein